MPSVEFTARRNGLFWIRRLSRLKRERLIRRFEKLSRG
jgi:peptide deformylase